MKFFNTIAALLTEIAKKIISLKWENDLEKAFTLLKEKHILTPLLVLSNFTKPFKIECDTTCIVIGAILLQDKKPITYLSEKLNGATLN